MSQFFRVKRLLKWIFENVQKKAFYLPKNVNAIAGDISHQADPADAVNVRLNQTFHPIPGYYSIQANPKS